MILREIRSKGTALNTMNISSYLERYTGNGFKQVCHDTS